MTSKRANHEIVDNFDIIDNIDFIGNPAPQWASERGSRSGVALVVTLGLLAVICVTVIAFVAAMRLERATAVLESDRATLRNLHHVGLSSAMRDIAAEALFRSYTTSWRWSDKPDTCLGSYFGATNTTFAVETVNLFRGAVTNLVPRAVHADAAAAESYWLPVISTIVENGDTAGGRGDDPQAPLIDNVVLGRIAYLVINCSGFLPPPVTNDVAGYAAQRHLPAELRDYTFHLAHDPDPEQYFAARPEYEQEPDAFSPGIFATLVTNKFDVNSWTNNLNPPPADDDIPLAYDPAAGEPYVAAAEVLPWVEEVAAVLRELRYDDVPGQAEKMAWNLLNLVDEDRLPQYRLPDGSVPLQPPSRADYAFENLPMINEVVVSNVAVGADSPPAYAVAVELWYPFEPEAAPQNLVLSVGIYTNSAGLPDVNTVRGPGSDLGPFGFTNVVPVLYSPGRQFHVAVGHENIKFADDTVENPAAYKIGAQHPLYIWPRLYLLCTNTVPEQYVCVDEALLKTGGSVYNIDNADNLDIIEWTGTGSWQASDPLFNLVPRDGEFGSSHTIWKRNSNLETGFEYPLFHLNGPLTAAGELGYLLLSQPGTGTVSLATEKGAALLDRFTAFPGNRAARVAANRIQPNSPYAEVIRRLFDEPLLSRPVEPADLPSIAVITNAWFSEYQEMIASNACWNTYAELLPDIARHINAAWQGLANDDAQIAGDERKLSGAAIVEDLLRTVAERATFRQNIYVVVVAAQRLSPTRRITADQRVAITVVRDSYTGQWAVHDWQPLSE